MPRTIAVEAPARCGTDLACVIDRVFVFDDFFSRTQLLLVEQWALKTPHWMLTNSVYDSLGNAQHRIWGASYIQAWQRSGWPGLPPVLFSTLATVFQKLGVVFRSQGFRHQTGIGKRPPEQVPGPRVVMSHFGRVGARINPDKNKFQFRL